MEIHLYNTMSREKEAFTPIVPGKVGIYQCGPTVYDFVHIGNLRKSVFDDLLRRVFEYNGFEVKQVMNITDVDDKTIRRSLAENVTLQELTRKYEKAFIDDITSMNILQPTRMPRATDNIKTIIEIINVLIAKDIAYATRDGVYLSIAKVPDYGKLARLKPDRIIRERISNDEYEKENLQDFALWKFHTIEDGETAWDAPFGLGRPGWHIECSAMALHELGETIDVHTGGTDHIFPHHTNEIAQSESATGKPFAHYWMHVAFLNIDDAKMAKSKGNFYKLSDLLEESISPLSYRYWLLGAHYRTQVNFTFEAVRAAQTALMRLAEHYIELGVHRGTVNEPYAEKFKAFVNDDIDTPKALALTWELMKDKTVADADKKATIEDFDRILGLDFVKLEESVRQNSKTPEVPKEVSALVEAREEARRNKDWNMADALRNEIEARGWSVKDMESGPEVKEL